MKAVHLRLVLFLLVLINELALRRTFALFARLGNVYLDKNLVIQVWIAFFSFLGKGPTLCVLWVGGSSDVGLGLPGNVISRNAGDGVRIWGSDTNANVVQRNLIGIDVSGKAALGNLAHGL